MDETHTAETVPAQTLSGMEINLGDFTRTQGLLKSLRLMLNSQIVVQVEEIASGVGEAGRKFKMGELEQAHQDVARLYSAFGQRTHQWESQARGLEQQMKAQAAKDPKSISIEKMNRMKSEQTAVRTRIRTAEVQFRRLHQGLEQAFINLQRPPVGATSETPLGLPAEFLARFAAATRAERPVIVQEYFEADAVIRVSVSRGATAGYEIKFDPTPPQHRLYYFAQSGQVIRLEQLANVVLVHDAETGRMNELKLVDFVKQVQSGVWLLKLRA